MHTITKPEEIEQWRFSLFMINTLSFQLEKWAELPEKTPIPKERREIIKHLRNKCRKVIELNKIKPLSPIEEELYEVGDEFHAIMGYIQNEKAGPFAHSMLSICTLLATDDFEGLEEFWRNLGIYISQNKIKKSI